MQGNGKDIPTASAACIDAETLAAWADGGLSKAEAAAVETHLADCERCTAMLATFARTIPAVPATESLWQRWHLRWLVPIATAATVAALFVLIPRQQQTQIASVNSAPATEAKLEQAAQTTAAPQPDPTQPAQPAEAKEQLTYAKRLESSRLQQPPEEERRADAGADAAQQRALNGTIVVPPSPAREADRAEAKRADAEPERFSPLADAKAAAPASPPAAASRPAPAAGATAPAAAAPPPAVSAETAFRQSALSSTAARTTTMFEVRSPNPMTRWRISGAGQVERSTNGGAQWERATLPESATLTVGSSPSSSICWLAGRSGAIYVTTDGLRFTRVPFRERTDFVSIQATDALRATVVTIDGRTMRTEDQGATWLRVGP